ncbi:MAG: glycosyltransferase family 4 protein, partial [Thermodesulfobacteriota bacterium]
MKILLLAPHPFFQNRGTPIAVRMLAETLSAAGHTIRLVTYPEGDDVQIENCTISRLPQLSWARGVKPGFSWKKLVYDVLLHREVKKILAEESFDVIHAVEESAFIAAHFGRIHMIPFVYDMDSSLSHQLGEKFFFLKPFQPLFRSLEKNLIRKAAGVIPVCRAIEELVLEYDPEALVGLLEDVSLLPPDDGSEPAEHTRLDLDEDKVYTMYVGNLESYQGIDLLLEAFVLAAEDTEKARLVIIGGADGDISSYQRRTEELGLTDRVRFVGRRPVSDLHHYLRQADILVSPR